MALDTNNNFVVTGYTGEANIATDFSLSETSHFQVVKMAYGSTAEEPIRVTNSTPLPVDIMNNPSVTATVSGSVSVTNNVAVYGIAGATAVGVTATDLDIRNLTAGTVTVGDPSTSTIDMVRVIGYSGGYPVGVTATDLDIRNLTAGTVTVGDPSTSTVDIVRVIGYSGGYPIAVSGNSFNIRSLNHNTDSVKVVSGVTVAAENSPFVASLSNGFGTRLLRATKGGVPETNVAILTSTISSDGTLEDTVRVVGLSGAYPVNTLLRGLTNIADTTTDVPLKVDDNGVLSVNLASGTINVTANISSSAFTLAGVSLANAAGATQTIQIRGYTGTDNIPVSITAAGFDIRGLCHATDSVYANTRFLGSCANIRDFVDFNGTAGIAINSFNSALADFVEGDIKKYRVRTDDVNAGLIRNELAGLCASVKGIADVFATSAAYDSTNKRIKVSVENVAQPTGVTSGKRSIPLSTSTQLTAVDTPLKSGVHLKTDLNAANSTIYIQSNGVAAGQGYPLFNGDQIFIEIDNLNRIWASADGAGSTLYYIAT
jgi:hypothetical protein